jgi:TolB-like protein/tetratricopeptide (TPR) repeat protein/tRNA A-37 threonylcarbamoyl transferase component Bud32
MTGTRLAHYRILEKLGAGGMGEVYRAHDEQLHREVAIKVLPADSFADATARARLLREARAAAALNHPAICTIHEVGEADGQSYIAMELVDGRSLSDKVRDGALRLDEVLRCGIQIADALAHAHARQVVHRDLKPANVVAGPDGRVKVLDFGLAKRIRELEPAIATTETHDSGPLTEAGTVVGTLGYMAPEQLRGQPADTRSDIWALGVLLYEIATGSRPFAGQSRFELSSNILNAPPRPLPATVPMTLRAVIDRCLEKQPARRYQSANEVRAAIEAIHAGTASYGRALAYRRPWLTAIVAVVIVAALAAAFGLDTIRTRLLGGGSRIDALAVLPLENLSGDASQDYLADGMTEVLSTDLARLAGLQRVTARSSVVRFKGSRSPLADIARELGVDALVTGAVQRSGNRISVTAQLLDPATGNQLWSNRYEHNLQDVLVLRNEIVSAIVRELRAQLSPIEQQRLATARPMNPEAFEAYLKGRFEWFKQTRESFDLAERHFQHALEKDPNYALAYAGLASVWFMRGDVGFGRPSETLPKARAFMDKAVALDDSVAELHIALGNQHCVALDWVACERSYRRALELNPNSADAHFFHGHLLIVTNRVEEANRMMERGVELDPLNDFHRSFYGWHLNYLQRYDEAIPLFQKLLQAGPNRGSNYLGLWGAYYRKGQYADALDAAREYFLATGDKAFADAIVSGGDLTAYRASMKRAADVMVVRSKQSHVPALRIARMFAHAGDHDAALQWLERAYENREPALMRLGVYWDWLDLHADPRFTNLLRRLNLPTV